MLSRRILFILAGVLAILILQPMVLAQDVVIFGYRVSFILLAPIILIVIFLIVFTIIVLKDILKEKSGSLMEFIGLKIKGINKVLGKKSEPELKGMNVAEEAEKEKPSMSYLSEISRLKKEIRSLPAQEAYERLMNIIRTFFSELLQIEYEFTFDELEKELNKKHKNIMFFSKNLSELCYSEQMSKSNLKNVLTEFEDIVKSIFKVEEAESERPPKTKGKLDDFLYRKGLSKPKGLMQKIEGIRKSRKLEKEFRKKEKERKTREKELFKRKEIVEEERKVQRKIEELKKKEDRLKKKSAPSSVRQDKLRVLSLINKAGKAVKKDAVKASDIYEQVYDLYSTLPEDDKKLLYPKVTRLYNRINKAMTK